MNIKEISLNILNALIKEQLSTPEGTNKKKKKHKEKGSNNG
jgi:hypothetical protein